MNTVKVKKEPKIKKDDFRCMICQGVYHIKAGSQVQVEQGEYAKLGYVVFTCRKFSCKDAAKAGRFQDLSTE